MAAASAPPPPTSTDPAPAAAPAAAPPPSSGAAADPAQPAPAAAAPTPAAPATPAAAAPAQPPVINVQVVPVPAQPQAAVPNANVYGIRESCQVTCPSCRAVVNTRVSTSLSTIDILCMVFSLFFVLGIFVALIIIFACHPFSDYHHHCPQCNAYIGKA